MELSRNGLELIQRHEGLRLKAYRCPADVPTIGYGSTLGVQMGDEITKAQAIELLMADIERFEDAVRRHVNVPLTQHQFDALVSFAFNVGVGAFQRSTLLRKLNAGDYRGAADELPRWSKGGGKVLAGLVRRREDERALFLTPVSEPKPTHWIDEVDAKPSP
jgi:lysozyme